MEISRLSYSPSLREAYTTVLLYIRSTAYHKNLGVFFIQDQANYASLMVDAPVSSSETMVEDQKSASFSAYIRRAYVNIRG